MNTTDKLKALFCAHGLAEMDGMNLLQEYGVISDNCVTIYDVPECDFERAKACLEKHKSLDP